jgi:chitinase
MQNPNSGKVDEIDNYPLFLQAIRDAIGDKELSIAVPGKEVDMIAFTSEKVPKINEIVDVVNVSKTGVTSKGGVALLTLFHCRS